MNTDDDFDQIERLFRLRESGALTNDEFEAEKSRVLYRGRMNQQDGLSPVAEHDVRVEPISHYGDATNNRRTVGIALVLVVVAGVAFAVWLWRNQSSGEQPAMLSTSKVAATSRPTTATPSSVTPSAASSKSITGPGHAPDQAQTRPSVWSVLDRDGDNFSALFGPPDADPDVFLNCQPDKRSISVEGWGVNPKNGASVKISVASGAAVIGTVSAPTNDMSSGTVVLPANSAPYSDLIHGDSPLRFKWSNGAVGELPNALILRDFLKKCRERSAG